MELSRMLVMKVVGLLAVILVATTFAGAVAEEQSLRDLMSPELAKRVQKDVVGPEPVYSDPPASFVDLGERARARIAETYSAADLERLYYDQKPRAWSDEKRAVFIRIGQTTEGRQRAISLFEEVLAHEVGDSWEADYARVELIRLYARVGKFNEATATLDYMANNHRLNLRQIEFTRDWLMKAKQVSPAKEMQAPHMIPPGQRGPGGAG